MSDSIHDLLLAPFDDDDIEWRLQWTSDDKTGGIAVPYVTNRAIQYRLDRVVGFDRWKNEYIPWHPADKKASQICGISIYFPERGEWVTKYDGAEDSDIEPIKGGLSDSMKRAAVQWGIGRYLYGMDTVFVKVETRGRTSVIAKSETGKLNQAHQAHIAKLFGNQTASMNIAPTQVKSSEIKKDPPATSQKFSGPRELPPAALPQNSVWVNKVAVVPDVSGGSNTNLQIRDVSGNVTEVYLHGEHQGLVPGAALFNTRFSKRESQGVVFIFLDSYEIAAQAA